LDIDKNKSNLANILCVMSSIEIIHIELLT
jgi:hypothetical protein